MFVIFCYDISSQKRLVKVLKKSRAYLFHVQNSVFEGTLSKGLYKEFKDKIFKLIDEKEDSLIFYTFLSNNSVRKDCYGIANKSPMNFI